MKVRRKPFSVVLIRQWRRLADLYNSLLQIRDGR